RFVAKDELLVYRIAIPRCRRHKEPFTLAAERPVLAAISQPGRNLELVLASANCERLQSLFRLHDARCSAGNRGDKPLALVLTAEKASRLPRGRTNSSRCRSRLSVWSTFTSSESRNRSGTRSSKNSP